MHKEKLKDDSINERAVQYELCVGYDLLSGVYMSNTTRLLH